MLVYGIHPLGFGSLIEVLVTDENNGEIRLVNPPAECLVYDSPIGTWSGRKILTW